ncbi:Nn.00g063900.m01.CDS01 [Neocucurbitaria sp. VM-36]
MAEVAGLVVGVVGLAGLIGGFKSTVDLFHNFTDSRDLGRDYEILDIKLDIEKTILLQWAEQVNFLRDNYDRRLDEPDTRRAVEQIFACIRLLLSDESKLKQLYGLTDNEEKHDPSTTTLDATISSHRMERFVQEFQTLKLRLNLRNDKLSLSRKVRWIIHDKQKFEILVKEVAHFTTKLNEIMPIYRSQTVIQRVTDEDVATIEQLRGLNMVLDASAGQRNAFAESTQRRITLACQERILHLLWYRRMNDREESISPAHADTFHWALEPPPNDASWADFSKWLRYDSGMYWISGKAGSGKSTLMKYLFYHPTTRNHLSQWAGNTSYSLIRHYFWSLGSDEQKSQAGLTRALLYQLLSNNRALIKQALPHLWEQVLLDEVDAIDPPSVAETRLAFRVIASASSSISKFCFFIDGIDEFEGNHVEGVAFIKELAVHNHIKIVVASRPIPACVTSFENLPTLHLHQLTRPDITSYVQNVLGGHEYMHGLIGRHPREARAIIRDVVAKSSGVFLWVILACRSLLSGFSDYDQIQELRRRVEELPPELEEMFQHMLMKVDKRHREQGVRFLRLCYEMRQSRRSFQWYDISSIGLACMDNYGPSQLSQVQTLSLDQKRWLCKELDGRLKSRCGGLLELSRTPKFCLCREGHSEHDNLVDSAVIFMHRSVFEFLSTDHIWTMECLHTSEELELFSELSLIGLYSALLGVALGHEGTAMDFFHQGLQCGVLADRHHPSGRNHIFWLMPPFLDCLARQRRNDSLSNFTRYDCSENHIHVRLLLAIESGACNFVKAHSDLLQYQQNSPEQNIDSVGYLQPHLPPLYHVIMRPLLLNNVPYDPPLFQDMLSLLLSYGMDPNERIHCPTRKRRTTPWNSWVAPRCLVKSGDPSHLDDMETAKIFIQAGADANELFNWIAGGIDKKAPPHVQQKQGEFLHTVKEIRDRDPQYAQAQPTDDNTTAAYNAAAARPASNRPSKTTDNIRSKEESSSDRTAERVERQAQKNIGSILTFALCSTCIMACYISCRFSPCSVTSSGLASASTTHGDWKDTPPRLA